MIVKIFSDDSKFIAESNKDLLAIKIRGKDETVSYFLTDDEVRELQTLCEYHLRDKANNIENRWGE